MILPSALDIFPAIDGICCHEHVHLCDGLVMHDAVGCSIYGAALTRRTGTATCTRAHTSLKTFSVRVQDCGVWIEVCDAV